MAKRKTKLIPDDAKWILIQTWFDGGSWGAATSNPLVQEEWLSKEISDKIVAAAKAKYAEVETAVRKAKGDSRKVDFKPDNFDRDFLSGLSSDASIFCDASDIPYFADRAKEFFGTIPRLHILCIENNHGSWHRKGGVDRISMIPFEKCFIGFNACWDENYNGYYSGKGPLRFSLHYDFEKQQFRFRIFNRIHQEPCEECERKRRNWPRTKYRNLYLAKCMDKIQQIVADGFAFSDTLKLGSDTVLRFMRSENS